MCQEMDLKTVEIFLERGFCKARKTISGRGAKTKVSIMGDTIFVKMKTGYTGLEKNMFRFISGNNYETRYYDSIKEETTFYAQRIIGDICPDVTIKFVDFRIDIENDYAFAIILLNDDLEKLIRNGTVARPHQTPDDTPQM